MRVEGEKLILGFKEFCVRRANSRGALTPSNIHRILLGAPQPLHVSVSYVARKRGVSVSDNITKIITVELVKEWTNCK